MAGGHYNESSYLGSFTSTEGRNKSVLFANHFVMKRELKLLCVKIRIIE